jgi:hypothetical protein
MLAIRIGSNRRGPKLAAERYPTRGQALAAAALLKTAGREAQVVNVLRQVEA